MKPGTLVMLKVPEGSDIKDYAPPNGACGEVVHPGEFLQEIAIGDSCVLFPHTPSKGSTKMWRVPTTWLIPLSDPDADISDKTSEDFDVTMDKPITETI
jgi:hypothetical protein